MTLLTTVVTMLAFAAIYAAILAMLAARAPDLAAALLRRPLRVAGQPGVSAAASRRLSRA